MPTAGILPDLGHELRESSWLAGFIDGEGHLSVNVDRRHGNAWPVLEITQRDDDLDLMAEIHAALGGCLKRPKARGAHRSQARVAVIGKVALLGVVAYLDAHPLRTKKAAEYVIWRGAVLAYVEDGGKTPILMEAKMRLESLKQYVPPAVVA